MELEYKLAAIINSCKHDIQILAARNCYIQAAETKKITAEQYAFLKRLADQREAYLKDQRIKFETNVRTMQQIDIEESPKVDIFEVTLKPDTTIRIYEPEDVTAANVEKAAAGMKYVNDTDAD